MGWWPILYNKESESKLFLAFLSAQILSQLIGASNIQCITELHINLKTK